MASGIEDPPGGTALPSPPSGRRGWPWDAPPRPRRERAAFQSGRWPRITVVTPSFNQGAYIEATLRSVLLQGYPNLELIVVDGGSTDDTLAILERYRPHLSAWTSESDRGQAHAINKGLAQATGEVLGWLNSDDLLLPGSLARVGRAFARGPSVNVVAGLRREVRADGTIAGPWVRDLPRPHRLRAYCCVPQETVYWRRSVWQSIGGLDESKDFALDYEYWLRMLDAGYRFTELPAFLGGCRDHPRTKRATRSDDRDRDLASIYQAYGLGINEEDVLMRQGPEWSFRLRLLEDLSDSWLFADARRATAVLRWLEQPTLSRRAVSVAMRYDQRRADGDTRSRPRVIVQTLVDELLGRFFKRREPFLVPSCPLQRARRPASLNLDDALIDRGPFDELAVGRGWSWLEISCDQVYRWAGPEAEVLVLRPSGTRRQLRLAIEPGPSLHWQPFALTILDEDDRLLQRVTITAGQPVTVDVPLEAGPRIRCLRLRAPHTEVPASESDARILAFRAIFIGWEGEGSRDEPALRDLVLEDGRTVPIATASPDIVDAPVRALRVGDRRRPVPRAGLFLGRGWWPPVTAGFDDAWRWAADGSELVLTRPRGGRVRIAFDLEPEHANETVAVALIDGRAPVPNDPAAAIEVTGRRVVAFEFDTAPDVTQVLRLCLRPAARPAPRRVRVWRVS